MRTINKQKNAFLNGLPTEDGRFITQTNECGFTLIELLVVIGIISVLAVISLVGYKTYREHAYEARSNEMFQSAITALEAGKIESDSFGAATYTVIANKSSVWTGDADLIIPGLKADSNMYVSVIHNSGCSDPSCVVDYVTTRHCLSPKRNMFVRFYSGTQVQTMNFISPAGC